MQGFLADLLERGDLAGVDRSKGRFRSFLFARLRPALQGDALAPSYATIGAEVGMTPAPSGSRPIGCGLATASCFGKRSAARPMSRPTSMRRSPS